MKIDRKALKSAAWFALHRQTGLSPWRVTGLYLLLTGGSALLLELMMEPPADRLLQLLQQGMGPGQALALTVSLVGKVGLFAHILLLILRLVVGFGYAGWALRVSRGERTGAEALLDGFGLVGRVLLLEFAVAMLSLCWYVVISFPLTSVLATLTILPGGAVFAPVVIVSGLVLLALCVMRYAMARFCLLEEPERGVFHALRSSRRLMRGRGVEYGLLLLSFLGWYLLGVVVSWLVESAVITALGGIGIVLAGDMQAVLALSTHPATVVAATAAGWVVLLWLKPYLAVTQAGYYDRLRGQSTKI